LINGRNLPELDIAAGQVERWRFINACNARYVRLSLGGRPFRVIGGDNGLRPSPVTVTEVMITPGERVELAVGPFDDEGAEIAIESLPYSRGMGNKPRYSRWGTLRVGPRAASRASLAWATPTVEPLVPPGPVTPTREIRFEGTMSWRIVDWKINGKTHLLDTPVKVGELQIWEIVNTTGMDHPFHLHGFFFQVIAIDGVRVTPQTWDDTVNLPKKSRMTIAWVADDRPGMWMYHCHILEHHAAGMMGHFEVVR
jgi:FtsP/CotA-like multicopper oxidase with cupredoxin domain